MHGEPVAHLIEKEVAGILYRPHHVKAAVLSRVDPALRRRVHLLIDSLAVYMLAGRYDPLLQGCRSGQGLEGRPRRRLLLGGVVVKRQGLIVCKGIIVGCVYGICQPVVVVARVGHAGQDLPCPHIGHDAGAGAGIQGQVCRRYIQVSQTVHHEVIGGYLAGIQLPQLIVLVHKPLLLIDHMADLKARDGVPLYHVLIEYLGKGRILLELGLDMIHEGGIDLLGIHIALIRTYAGNVYPVIGYGQSQIGRK